MLKEGFMQVNSFLFVFRMCCFSSRIMQELGKLDNTINTAKKKMAVLNSIYTSELFVSQDLLGIFNFPPIFKMF